MSLERRLGSFKYFLTLVALTLLSSAAYVALGKHTQKKHFLNKMKKLKLVANFQLCLLLT
jgi:hypothetical protein